MSTLKRLNQVLATESATKKRAEDAFTRVYQDVQKTELVNGFSKQYRPATEEGERLPPENKRVVVRAEDALKTAKKALVELFDVTYLKDKTNQSAVADVVVDGQTLLTSVPATHLLFIEKRMVSIIELLRKLPALAADEQWTKDEIQGLFVTGSTETVRTKKVEEYKTIVQATKEFPAQTAKLTTDVSVGTWVTVKQSGAVPPDRIAELLERAEKVQRAVKAARQEANEQSVAPAQSSDALLSFIFN